MDPSDARRFVVAPVSGVDAVLVSHEHSDHNNVALATGSPLILRGLSSTGWNTIDQPVKDIRIYTTAPFNVYHDSTNGTQRGRNTIFIIEVDGLRLVHMGDLGHTLSPDVVRAIGAVDLILVPVGGGNTIGAAQATEVVRQLNPRIVIPMHYKTVKHEAGWNGVAVDSFLEGKKVEMANSNVLNLSRSMLPAETTVMVMNYE